jgi:hypothetical protein
MTILPAYRYPDDDTFKFAYHTFFRDLQRTKAELMIAVERRALVNSFISAPVYPSHLNLHYHGYR